MARVFRQQLNRPLKARMVGIGPMRRSLETLASELGLQSDRMEFLNERDEMDLVYREADLMVMTSEWEGTPNALLEAMAHGVPVVATCVGGIPEILGCGRGLLTEPRDERGIAAAVIQLIESSDLRQDLGRRGRDYVTRVHSLDALQSQLLETYQKVLCQ